MVRGSRHCKIEIFLTCPDRPRSRPSLLYSGYRVSYPRIERPRPVAGHPPDCIKNGRGISLPLSLPPRALFHVIWWTLSLLFPSKCLKQRRAFRLLEMFVAVSTDRAMWSINCWRCLSFTSKSRRFLLESERHIHWRERISILKHRLIAHASA